MSANYSSSSSSVTTSTSDTWRPSTYSRQTNTQRNKSGLEKDSEGLDIYCRWNGQGGEIILCDKCPNAFSRMAIQRNLGRAKMQEITAADGWKCPECDPKQIYEQQALYWAVWQRWKSGNYTTPAE